MPLLVPLLAAALAGPPPGVDTENPAPFEAAADKLRAGPAGCWEVVGKASWRWELGGPRGFAKGDAVFVGKLEDGVWRDFVIRSLGEDRQYKRQDPVRVFDHKHQRFLPLIGRFAEALVDDDGDGYGDNVITATLGRLGTDVSYAWTEWSDDAQAVVLHRKVPFELDREEATLDVVFPQGDPYPASLTVDFPDSFAVPNKRIVKVKDAIAKVRASRIGDEVFPQAESFAFGVSVLGFRGQAAQTITYDTYRPCGGETVDAPHAIVE